MLCHRLALELVCKRSRHLAKRFSYILHREVLLTEALNPACLGWLRAHANDIVTLRIEANDLDEGVDTVATAVRCLLCRSGQLQDVHFTVDIGDQELNLAYKKDVWPGYLRCIDAQFKSELVLASTSPLLTSLCAAGRVCPDRSSRRRWQRAIWRLCDLLRWLCDL
jgi:hypothetical protein